MSARPLSIRDIRSFHVGGENVTLHGLPEREVTVVPGAPSLRIDPNGEFIAWQMYARHVRLENPRVPGPVAFWHGGGMTGVAWETKPDGQRGWEDFFLRAGFDTLVSDAVERGRAGWAHSPQIFVGEPFFMSMAAAWQLYRLGTTEGYAARQPFPSGRFPIAFFERFASQMVPRWFGNEDRTKAAYEELLEQVGPCVVVAHSQGALFALGCAARHPDKLMALVLIEPGGVPALDYQELAILASISLLVIWGDDIGAVPFWAAARAASDTMADTLSRNGGDVTIIDLPAQGTAGNSHLLMMDDNSDVLAGLVCDWLIGRLAGFAGRDV